MEQKHTDVKVPLISNLLIAVIYGCIFAACHIFCFAKTKEVVKVPEKEKTSLKVQLSAVAKNRPYMIAVAGQFIRHTQPREWAAFERQNDIDPVRKFCAAFNNACDMDGVLYVLRNGFKHRGTTFSIIKRLINAVLMLTNTI